MGAIRQSEGLWRDVFREKQKRAVACPVEERIVSQKTKAIFGTAQAPDPNVSVNLYDRVTLQYATVQGDQRASQIEGSDGVQGWLVISVANAGHGLRRVKPSPQCDNPYHVEIVLPAEHAKGWEDAEVHLREFLSLSRWQDRKGSLP